MLKPNEGTFEPLPPTHSKNALSNSLLGGLEGYLSGSEGGMTFNRFSVFQGLCGGSGDPGHLKLLILKPVGRMSMLGEFDLSGVVPGVLPRGPRTPILHFKTKDYRPVARNCSEILRNPSWRKTGHADDWVLL